MLVTKNLSRNTPSRSLICENLNYECLPQKCQSAAPDVSCLPSENLLKYALRNTEQNTARRHPRPPPKDKSRPEEVATPGDLFTFCADCCVTSLEAKPLAPRCNGAGLPMTSHRTTVPPYCLSNALLLWLDRQRL